MNGWARLTPSGKWHQVQTMHVGQGAVRIEPACGARPLAADLGLVVAASAVMDYRWTPPDAIRCERPECQREVEP